MHKYLVVRLGISGMIYWSHRERNADINQGSGSDWPWSCHSTNLMFYHRCFKCTFWQANSAQNEGHHLSSPQSQHQAGWMWDLELHHGMQWRYSILWFGCRLFIGMTLGSGEYINGGIKDSTTDETGFLSELLSGAVRQEIDWQQLASQEHDSRLCLKGSTALKCAWLSFGILFNICMAKSHWTLRISAYGSGNFFDVAVNMSCRKGSLVTQGHEVAKHEWIAFSQLAYRRRQIHDKLIINHGHGTTSSVGATKVALLAPANSLDPREDNCSDFFADGF